MSSYPSNTYHHINTNTNIDYTNHTDSSTISRKVSSKSQSSPIIDDYNNTLKPNTHPRESSNTGNTNRSRRTPSFSTPFDLSSSSSSSANTELSRTRPLSNPDSGSGTSTPTERDFKRSFTLVKNSIRMSTKRGNRYVLGAVITLGVFAFWHISGTGSGAGAGFGSSTSTSSRSKGGFGLWPSTANSGSILDVNNGGNSGNVDSNAFIRFDEAHIPETEFVKGVAGFNYFKNLYLCNGTFIALTSNPSSMPDVTHIMSAHPTDDNKYPPAGLDRWRVMVLGQDDLSGFGGVAIRKDGISKQRPILDLILELNEEYV
uniref:Uncharacterized protein n=1 Tax=Kwoniella dejecticola CBS 10117 TaxID=1296121 RepID=A0A1A6A4P1_9TREE|nr:uncharacterized protein I303_04356 [Kwoniella dejecticola CBS 10117]OBR85029.1 hypothetical protein I303_04356 [Kwoniella dejecticola CBS 10117]